MTAVILTAQQALWLGAGVIVAILAGAVIVYWWARR